MKRLGRIVLAAAIAICVAAPFATAAPLQYSLSIFHFDIESVIGGLYGFVPAPGDWPTWDISPEAVEDMIVTESFAPLLALLQAHPEWTFTIEMQAYMVEVLAARHADVLAALQKLTAAGQVELVSFHYAGQFFIAHPYDDWKQSLALAQQVFAANNLKLSGVVFCQDGQAAEGIASHMSEEGYTVMAWPADLWTYQHGAFDAAPYYEFGDARLVVAGQSVADAVDGVYVSWSYMGDGELLATGGVSPYFPWFFHDRSEAVANFAAAVEQQEEQGYLISSIAGYVQALQTAGIAAAQPPPLLDGAWQPATTDGNSRWLGGIGVWAAAERDNHVRTLAAMAHREILAAQTIAAAAGLDSTAVLAEAWRQLALGEVSNGTGVNPYLGEVDFCIASSAEAFRIARAVIYEAKATLGLGGALIDTATGAVTPGEFAWPGAPTGKAPLQLTVAADGRSAQVSWFAESQSPPTWRVEIAFSASLVATARTLSVTFPGTGDEIQTTTALVDDAVQTYARSDFSFDHWYLPAPIGLVGLGGGWWVVKDQANVHVAARIETADSDVQFVDNTAPWFETITWIFHVVQGADADALALADRINVHPTLAR
jgi:hypothetical protein